MLHSDWFIRPKLQLSPKYRLFCFPYAGGGASIYHHWQRDMPEGIELVAIQLPGRANRLADRAVDQMDVLTDRLLQEIRDELDVPYMFFGHSLGSRVAFDLCRKIAAEGLPLPLHFWASGSRGPQLACSNNPIHGLEKAAFIDELKKLKGTPDFIFDTPSLLDLLLPMLRADFKIAETYQYDGTIEFDIPLTVLGGRYDEHVEMEKLRAWTEFFSGETRIRIFDGGHFFIDSHYQEVVEVMKETLGEKAFV